MNDQLSTLKTIRLPSGVEIIPLNAWLFAIQSSFPVFQSWHETLYKKKGKHFPIYKYQHPLPSPSQLSILECESIWEDIYDFIRQWLLNEGAITLGDLSRIQLDDIRDNPISGTALYLDLVDIIKFSKASKIGLELFEEVSEQLAIDREKNKIKSKSAVTNGNNTILEILGGVIIDAYGYDIHAKRYDFILELQQNLERVGVSIGDDSLKKWIRAASEIIEKENSTKRR